MVERWSAVVQALSYKSGETALFNSAVLFSCLGNRKH
ncbi:MAG: hypothetical protein IGNPGNKH_00498 [Sodalis sp. Ffu]|nr:MAG: hypothetical protein IGNPGNKH_00498 [Sodalis sp. Ffu]